MTLAGNEFFEVFSALYRFFLGGFGEDFGRLWEGFGEALGRLWQALGRLLGRSDRPSVRPTDHTLTPNHQALLAHIIVVVVVVTLVVSSS